MDFYAGIKGDKPDTEFLMQGDILYPLPFLQFSATSASTRDLITNKDEAKRDLTKLSGNERVKVAADVDIKWGLVISQTCDLARRNRPILIARISAIKSKLPDFVASTPQEAATSIQLAGIENPGKQPTLFYLKAFETGPQKMDRSVADLLEIQCFHPRDYQGLLANLHQRLGPEARQALQERLAYCFGRYALPDHFYCEPAERDFLTSPDAQEALFKAMERQIEGRHKKRDSAKK